MIIKYSLVFLTLFYLQSGYGQDVEKKPTNHEVNVDFKLPTALANRAFKNVMNGLADVDLGYQYLFPKLNIYAGLGFKYGYWDVETNFFGGQLVGGQLEFLNPFGKIGYRVSMEENIYLDIAMKTGYAYIRTNSVGCSEDYYQSGISLEPKIGLFLKPNPLVALGLTANYFYTPSDFTEENLCILTFPGLDSEASIGNYQYFSIGFGATFTIGTK